MLLLHGCTALDPPELPPSGYVNLMHRARNGNGRPPLPPDDDDYENAEDVLDEGAAAERWLSSSTCARSVRWLSSSTCARRERKHRFKWCCKAL